MAAEASFKTEILSISAGFNRSKPPSRAGIPSITIKGLELPNVFVPLILMVEPS
ncbi:hypothetical protein D3C87_1951370 [compost metagenome]